MQEGKLRLLQFDGSQDANCPNLFLEENIFEVVLGFSAF